MFIRTILGDISPDQLGVCDCHDHLIRSGGAEPKMDPDFLLDSAEMAIRELNYWYDAGGRAIVDMDVTGCGRNIPKMLQIAQALQGKVNIIMSTGFHKAGMYDVNVHWTQTTEDIDEITDMIVAEIEEGLDLNSYNGPIVKRVPNKAGIIKAGTSYMNIQAFEKRTLEVAARAQMKTGCPISVHTERGTMAYEAAEFLKEKGADLSHVILFHVQKNPDRYYHKKVMETGVIIGYDGPDRAKYYPDIVHAENLKWLTDQGFQKQIVLGMDAARMTYQRAYMEQKGRTALGMAYLLERFVPLLKEVGISDEAIEDMLINNPARVLSFNR